jgi:hypothetical protein
MTIDTTVSPDTKALCQRLLKVPSGNEITFTELAETLGRSVQHGSARGLLDSARRIVLRDHGVAFEAIRGRGLRRLTADEAARIGTRQRHHIRRTSKRAIKDMDNVASKSNGLSAEAQRQLSIEIAAHGLLAHIAKDRIAQDLPSQHDGQPTPVAVTARNLVDRFSA